MKQDILTIRITADEGKMLRRKKDGEIRKRFIIHTYEENPETDFEEIVKETTEKA